MKGLIHIYTGNGKGKTTAAVGLAVRCAGSGGKVLFTQFLKDNKSSELNLLKTLDGIECINSEKTFGFTWNMSEEDKLEAKLVYTGLLQRVIQKVVQEDYHMLVLDEIISTYNYEFINQQYLLEFLMNKPETLEVVMTGREPAKELIELADYVSEIMKVKHPIDQGIGARIGIEK